MNEFVSIITVNFNGKKYLKDFLNSAVSVSYPKDIFEIIVVDNSSSDGSQDFIKSNFPQINLIELKKNIGFGLANNCAMKNASGDFFLLVNNDTVLDKDCIKNMVVCYKKWSKKCNISAVNSKLVLFDKYIYLKVQEALFSGYKIPRRATPINKRIYLITHERSSSYTEDIYLPLNYNFESEFVISIELSKFRREDFSLSLGDQLIKEKFKAKDKKKCINIFLNKETLKNVKVDLIQNAGNVMFRDGFGRDRGAMVMRHQQYYERDMGQYDKEEKILTFCGAGVLLSKKAIEKVGYFNKDYFMYYEDSELSLRMKGAGYKIIYCPSAVIRHIHSASSKEWSPLFNFNVEKNRLITVIKYWPRSLVIKEWLKYILRNTFMMPLYYILNKDIPKGILQLKLRLRVNLFLIRPFFVNILNNNRLTHKEIKKLI